MEILIVERYVMLAESKTKRLLELRYFSGKLYSDTVAGDDVTCPTCSIINCFSSSEIDLLFSGVGALTANQIRNHNIPATPNNLKSLYLLSNI